MPNPQNVINKGKKWKKGESGNLKGRPKKLPHLEELLADVLGEVKDGKTAAEAILMALRSKATKGDVRAAEVLLERAYGKIKQDIDQKTEHSGSIDITWQEPPVRNTGNKGSPGELPSVQIGLQDNL